jgi:hypothetical protein
MQNDGYPSVMDGCTTWMGGFQATISFSAHTLSDVSFTDPDYGFGIGADCPVPNSSGDTPQRVGLFQSGLTDMINDAMGGYQSAKDTLTQNGFKFYFCKSDSPCSPSSPSFVFGLSFPGGLSAQDYDADSVDLGMLANVKSIILGSDNVMSYDGSCGSLSESPLLVQLAAPGRKPEPLALSSQLGGILFDILGLNSTPLPFTKKQISWLLPGSRDTNYFLVLPRRGQVNGINQMFGNNTLGPDGKFAANGYEALRKWDGRLPDGKYDLSAANGYIDRQDWIFSQLRLWADLNGDGIAQADELYSLDQLNVQSIDLTYDSNYVETDQYGNQTRMKSVLTTTDGQLHLVYDLWFKLFNR